MSYFKILINWQKRTHGFWQLIKIFLKLKIPLLELSINCQNLQVIFWQLIKSLIKVSINWLIFRRLIKKFDQLKMSSEFRSNDPLSRDFLLNYLITKKCYYSPASISNISLLDIRWLSSLYLCSFSFVDRTCKDCFSKNFQVAHNKWCFLSLIT